MPTPRLLAGAIGLALLAGCGAEPVATSQPASTAATTPTAAPQATWIVYTVPG